MNHGRSDPPTQAAGAGTASRVDGHAGDPEASQSYERSERLRERAHRLIPGGCHTYAKGDDQYPVLAPGFIARGQGCRVWDVDGNEFIEYGGGLRSVTLGHAYPRTVAAAYEAMLRGTNFVRPAPIEVQAAEELLATLQMERAMVKFAKNGSDATTAAVKLARAVTGRDRVAICQQPFFSVDDWFIGATSMAAGISDAVRAMTVSFPYNDEAALRALFLRDPGSIACVVMEAVRNEEPAAGYLHAVQQICRENGALLVLDEMITGFRWHNGGARAYYGLEPDLMCFGKGMGNGFSVAALVGRPALMERGGLRWQGERVFLLSLTHGAETTGLAAALATMRVYREEDVVGHLWRAGERLASGLLARAQAHGVERHVLPVGMAPNLAYATLDEDGRPSQAFRTLFLQETIRRGVLAPSLVVGYAHDDDAIDRTLDALDGALGVYRRALEDGLDGYLVGRSVQPVFRDRVGIV